jgi:hypothetical protein
MQNHTRQKPIKVFSIITSIIVALNILGTIFVGLILYFVIEASDPPSGDTFSIEIFYRQKNLDQSTIGLLIFIFIIAFIVALILWLKGKRFGVSYSPA